MTAADTRQRSTRGRGSLSFLKLNNEYNGFSPDAMLHLSASQDTSFEKVTSIRDAKQLLFFSHQLGSIVNRIHKLNLIISDFNIDSIALRNAAVRPISRMIDIMLF
jgi:hypothetical protein